MWYKKCYARINLTDVNDNPYLEMTVYFWTLVKFFRKAGKFKANTGKYWECAGKFLFIDIFMTLIFLSSCH